MSYTYNLESLMATADSSVTYSGVYPEARIPKLRDRGRGDAQNRRKRKTVSGATTEYFYLPAQAGLGGVVIGERRGTEWRDYLYFAGQRVAWIESLTSGALLHSDHLGSVRLCTFGTTVLGTCEYEPFGEAQPGSSCSLPSDHRFAGMEWDAETGLYHTWFRQYDPQQGRWSSVDPLAGSADSPQSLDRYAYVSNDPVNFIDPLGLTTDLTWGDLACVFQWGRRPEDVDEGDFERCVGAEGRGLLPISFAQWDDMHIRPDRGGPTQGAPPVSPCIDTSNAKHRLNNQMDITTAEWRGFEGFGQVVNAPISGVISGSKPTGTGPYPPNAPSQFAKVATHVSITNGPVTVTLVHVSTPIPVGAAVQQAQPFAATTPTGRLDAAHVHIEVTKGGVVQDPRALLPNCKPTTGPG